MVDKNGKKSTKIEVERRVSLVVEMLSKGWTETRIIHHIADSWGCGERQARNYIRKADTWIYEHFRSTERTQYLTRRLHQLDGIVQQSLDSNQPAAAIGAISLACKLVGVGQQAG